MGELIELDLERIHTCSVCGRRGFWTETWTWYGSYRDVDKGKAILKFCSDRCRKAYQTLPAEEKCLKRLKERHAEKKE